jgi:hypothetical protein
MTDWLKAWGLPQQRLRDDWKNHKGGLLTRVATFSRRPSARPGDRLFYYAVGDRVVFGIYEVTSLPFESDEDGDRFTWTLKVRRVIDLDFLHDGVPIEELNVDGRDLRISIRQKGAIRLRNAEPEVAEAELRRRVELADERETALGATT